MKNLKIILKRARLTLGCLLLASMSYAQTVSVPVGCRVVVAGVGGTLGVNPVGQVGDGGMVSMPDPTGGGTFTFNPPAGTGTVTWNLKGDLSNTLSLPNNYGTPTQPANGLTATIRSYNKFLRPNSTETSNPTWARSKGQVRVGYDQTGCGKSIVFDVFKTFTASPITNVPAIVGPDCLKPITTYTYSVDRIVSDNVNDAIGFDSYYWSGIPASLLASGTFYTSADNSSITFTTGATVTGFTLQCCYGRVNPNTADGGVSMVTTGVVGSHTTCISKPLITAPQAPAYLSAPPPCLATNLGNFTVVYPNAPAGLTYTWTAPNTGWTGLSTPVVNLVTGNTTLTVNTSANTNPGQLILTITGSCDPVTIVYQIDRSITSPYAVIPTGGTTTCINATSTGNTYTLSPNPGGNSIEWFTVPTSVTGVTLLNANTPTVTVNTSGASGSFTLNARSAVAACNSTSVGITINVRPTTPTFIASTPTCVPLSSPALTTFGVNAVPGAISYTWTLPPGWSCTSCNTATPTLTPPTNTSGVAAAAMPPGTITVVANSAVGCSSSVAASMTINYIRITSNTLQSGLGNCDQYSINTNVSPCTGTITNWTVNGTTAVSNGTTVNIFGNTLTLCGNTAPPAGGICANIVVNGVAYSTCSSTVATGTHGLRQVTPKVILSGVKISPNPNNGVFSIKVDDVKESAMATLVDFTGNEISKYNLFQGENQIEHQRLVPGTYFIILLVDGQQETRQIIVK